MEKNPIPTRQHEGQDINNDEKHATKKNSSPEKNKWSISFFSCFCYRIKSFNELL